MDENKLLESLKLRLTNIPEDLIKDLIVDAITDVKIYINLPEGNELPVGIYTAIKDLVMVRANRLGAEGISSESFSGVSQSYESDIPKDIIRKIIRFRRLG